MKKSHAELRADLEQKSLIDSRLAYQGKIHLRLG